MHEMVRDHMGTLLSIWPGDPKLPDLTVIVLPIANFRGLASFLPNLYRNQATLHYRRYVSKKLLLVGYLLRAQS